MTEEELAEIDHLVNWITLLDNVNRGNETLVNVIRCLLKKIEKNVGG